MLRKLFGLAVLSMLLVLTLCVTAQAAETQEISGQVKASQLTDGAEITLTGDTVLTVDADRTVETIKGSGAWDEPGTKLAIQGEKTLSVGQIVHCDVTMSSGTLAVGYLECPALTVNGGEVRGDLNLMPRLDGYGMLRCINLYDSLTVNGGRITFDGGPGIHCGIRAETITVTDGYIDIKNCEYAAICVGKMTVSGGEVHAIAEGTGISDWDGIVGFEDYEGEYLTILGGRVEAIGTWQGTTREDGYSVGVAMPNVTVTGGTLIATGSVSAINSNTPIQLDGNVKVRLPEDGFAATEPTELEQSKGWSGYSILNADGTRATTAVLSAPVEAAATGTMGEKDELTWSYYEDSGAVTVEGEGISEATPVIVASYDGEGRLLLVDFVKKSGDSAKADDEAEGVRLFWLNSEGGPQCGSETVKGPNSFSGQ